MKAILMVSALALIVSAVYGQSNKTACRKKAIEKRAKSMGYDLTFDSDSSPKDN